MPASLHNNRLVRFINKHFMSMNIRMHVVAKCVPMKNSGARDLSCLLEEYMNVMSIAILHQLSAHKLHHNIKLLLGTHHTRYCQHIWVSYTNSLEICLKHNTFMIQKLSLILPSSLKEE